MVPMAIIRSAWRGEEEERSAPKREKSKSLAIADIYSIPQQAVAKGRGHMEYFRHMPMAFDRVVTMRPPCSSR